MADSDIDEMLSQYGESRPTERAPRPTLGSKLWDNRPWKSHVGNAPSLSDQIPYLAMIAGLLHPRLGGATRDLGMARALAGSDPVGQIPASARWTPNNQSVPQLEQIGNGVFPSRATMQRQNAMADVRANTANANTPQPSPYRQGSPVAAYETYLNGLRPGEEPMSYWRFVREVLGQ